MLILESYIFLGGEFFLNQYAAQVSTMFLKTIGEVKVKAASCIMLSLDALMRKFPIQGTKMLVDGGVINKILKCCNDTIFEREAREPDVTLVQWMSVLARCFLADRSMTEAAVLGAFDEADSVVDLFIGKFDSAGYGPGASGAARRKLWVCNLTR